MGWIDSADANSESSNDRPTVRAASYLILRSPIGFVKKNGKMAVSAATKVRRFQSLWDLASKVMVEADAVFARKFTAIAFTHNFEGSPHIDSQNIGPFYGLALGDYDGGELCVESGVREVTMCDMKGRMACVDGRYPHWVAPYSG